MDGLQVPMEHVLGLASLLFAMGLTGLMVRRNILFVLMSLEVMRRFQTLDVDNATRLRG